MRDARAVAKTASQRSARSHKPTARCRPQQPCRAVAEAEEAWEEDAIVWHFAWTHFAL